MKGKQIGAHYKMRQRNVKCENKSSKNPQRETNLNTFVKLGWNAKVTSRSQETNQNPLYKEEAKKYKRKRKGEWTWRENRYEQTNGK